MRLLLTGATGFLGRHVMAKAPSHALFYMSRAAQSANEGEIAMGGSLWTAAQFAQALALSRPDVIFHCAGDTGNSSAQATFEANAVLAAHLLEAALAAERRPRVIVIGSAAEYGPVPAENQPVKETWACSPASSYGVAKYAQTLLARSARELGLPVLTARLFNAVGVGMPANLALPSFARRIARSSPGSTLRVGDLSAQRDFIDVEEAARLLIELARLQEWPWPVVNLCSGHAYRIGQLLDDLIAVAGVTVNIGVDATLIRKTEASVLVGDTERLVSLGLKPAEPVFSVLLPRLLVEAQEQAQSTSPGPRQMRP